MDNYCKSIDEVTQEILTCIQRALNEDIGPGDITTNSLVPERSTMKGQIIAKQAGIIAGLDIAQATFILVDNNIQFSTDLRDGVTVEDRQVVAELSGPARGLLTAERTALNFLGRMSGIATLTHRFVKAVEGTHAVILDTRKTAPGLRAIDKLAVRLGGGQNHRTGLYDMILIKDNHIDHVGSMAEAIERARQARGDIEIEVEARTLEDVQTALVHKVKRILLDNMSPATMKQAVELTAGRAKLEASGNVTIDNVRQVAESGVDFISIGALTHSVKCFDVSLDWIK